MGVINIMMWDVAGVNLVLYAIMGALVFLFHKFVIKKGRLTIITGALMVIILAAIMYTSMLYNASKVQKNSVQHPTGEQQQHMYDVVEY